MTSGQIKAALANAARRYWPRTARASDLPFPEYWRGATEYLTFHAPRVGDALMMQFVEDMVREAVDAESLGLEPRTPVVSEEVRKIWAKDGRRASDGARRVASGGGGEA